jgi:RNA polymerase sigma-70 factor (ECF subfamily)
VRLSLGSLYSSSRLTGPLSVGPGETGGNQSAATTNLWEPEKGVDAANQPAPTRLSSPDGFAAFYDEALPRVYTYFHYRSREMHEAEDLTQETFLAAVAELKKGKSVTEPVGWIMGIARHKLIDRMRSREREERRLALVWQAEQVSDDDRRLLWGAEESSELALIALRSLPESQRAALALRYLDGLTVSEVARQLGRSVHATESLLARGREGFKRRYVESHR